MAKVSCILCHWGVQLILAYSWAMPAILVAGKGRSGGRGGAIFISLGLHFRMLHFLPCLSLSLPLLSVLSLLPFSGRQLKMIRNG